MYSAHTFSLGWITGSGAFGGLTGFAAFAFFAAFASFASFAAFACLAVVGAKSTPQRCDIGKEYFYNGFGQ